MEEKELLIRLKEGDQEAFRQIYIRYRPRIFQNTLRLLKSGELAEELLQETFIRLWDKRRMIDAEKPFKAYLFKIAENLAYDYFRRIEKDRRLTDHLIRVASEYYDHIDSMIEFKEGHQLLSDAIAQLPAKRREVFVLCKLDGKSYAEVSQLLNISESTISTHIVKATKFLKAYFSDYREASLVLLLACLFSK